MHHLARLGLWLVGWRAAGSVPEARKFVVIAVPHTSNWDFVYGMLASWWFAVPFRWLGKRSLFEGWLGPLMRFCGGLPIDRSHPEGLVDQLAARFEEEEVLMLGIAPEGTRSHAEHWKSGFYRIALGAKVPLVLGFIDHDSRQAGIGPVLSLTGDMGIDMDEVRAFYAGIEARRPEGFGPIRLRGEDEQVE